MTTWADVSSVITVAGSGTSVPGYQTFSGDDVSATWSYLFDLYTYSSTARALLDSIVANNQTLIIGKSDGPGVTALGQTGSNRTTGYNLQQTDLTYYLDDHGNLVVANPHLVLIHEIYHALSGIGDPQGTANERKMPTLAENNASFNFAGSVVDFQNVVAQQMAMSNEPSYGTVMTKGGIGSDALDYLATKVSYTFGHKVDLTVIPYDANPTDSAALHTLDYSVNDRLAYSSSFNAGIQVITSSIAYDVNSNPIAADELIVGFAGNNLIFSGGGNDYLYGGNNDDTFLAGAGNNFVDGGNYVGGSYAGAGTGSKSTTYLADGIDFISYAQGSHDASGTGAAVNLDGGASGVDFLGKKTINVSDNGHLGASGADGADQLYSIENIANINTLSVSSLDLSSYAITPDANTGIATLWASGMVSGVGSSSGVVDFKLSNVTISFAATAGPVFSDWQQVLSGGVFSGLAERGFTVFQVHGNNDTIRFGDLGVTTVQLAGIGDVADFSGAPGSVAVGVSVGSGDTVIAGAGGLTLTALDAGSYEGTLSLPGRWRDYQINYDAGSDTYGILASDGSAGLYTAHQIASFQFADATIGAADLLNRAPTFASGAAGGTATERDSLSGSTLSDTASGSFAFTDPDVADAHGGPSVSFLSGGLVGGGTVPSALLTALATSLTATTADNPGTGGTVGWSFGVQDSHLDFLAAGQHLTAAYDIAISDVKGATAHKEIDIDIVGTNDAPVFLGGTPVRSVTDAVRNGNGIMIFTDADTIDTHSVTGIALVSGGANGAMGALTATLVHDSTGGATSEIDWAYHLTEVPTAAIQEVWRITLSDGHGGTATHDANINIAPASHPNNYQLPVDLKINETVVDGQVGGPNNIVGGLSFEYLNPAGPRSSWTFQVTGANSDDYYVWGGSTLALKYGTGVAHSGDVVHLVATATYPGTATPLPTGQMPKVEFDLPITVETAYQFNNGQHQTVVQNHLELAA